ncbi:hypothetical protein OAO87_04850, partial [bacterium]|nr:hypothetical protein [bacterium]
MFRYVRIASDHTAAWSWVGQIVSPLVSFVCCVSALAASRTKTAMDPTNDPNRSTASGDGAYTDTTHQPAHALRVGHEEVILRSYGAREKVKFYEVVARLSPARRARHWLQRISLCSTSACALCASTSRAQARSVVTMHALAACRATAACGDAYTTNSLFAQIDAKWTTVLLAALRSFFTIFILF